MDIDDSYGLTAVDIDFGAIMKALTSEGQAQLYLWKNTVRLSKTLDSRNLPHDYAGELERERLSDACLYGAYLCVLILSPPPYPLFAPPSAPHARPAAELQAGGGEVPHDKAAA